MAPFGATEFDRTHWPVAVRSLWNDELGVGVGVGVVTGVLPPVVDDDKNDDFPAPAPQPVIPPTASRTASSVLFGLQKRKRASRPGYRP